MTHHLFEPDDKKGKGRNRYVGKWVELATKPISLPFTKQSLVTVLKWGCEPEKSSYTHQDIAHWCDSFPMQFHLDQIPEEDPQFLGVSAVVQDISAQWEMFLFNTYTLDQLRSLDVSKVRLPQDWFKDWLSKVSST